ncbi:hypothetical protein AGABI2DRAFT_194528 [Agaricus bisporus var. bisporus H97]|uniref:hypothetical protein n=1 Tax=Agaricus bisporus var. bisporus (strain H97 / ATCC MYA-4626 / FGSC 10389) TaxID=936046 RepID=UPI00029F67D4|nr:hypothetical protein AGABI2DRAFT_194528 [Agaricus bisporus var. bisporus H97]EKV44511.1 hypothetical protein AGABI2DRAFT_194528 [Agaricus bisporus var. bisporus H97]
MRSISAVVRLEEGPEEVSGRVPVEIRETWNEGDGRRAMATIRGCSASQRWAAASTHWATTEYCVPSVYLC